MSNQKKETLRKQADLSVVVYGKVPPQAPDLEEAVLGALMVDRDCILSVMEILTPDCFYDDRHRIIFTAMQNLFNRPAFIDLLIVTEELRASGQLEEAGGPYYITQLTNRVATSAHVEHHARIIKQKFISREIIRISSIAVHDAYEDTTDVFQLLRNTNSEWEKINSSISKNSIKNKSQIIQDNLKEIETAMKHVDSLRGVPSGFTKIDRLTGGWMNSDLIIIAARPSMGKSAFAVNMAKNASIDYDVATAVFSLEMASKQLITRLASDITEFDSKRISSGGMGELDFKRVIQAHGIINNKPIYIDDTPGLSIFELRMKIRRLIELYGIKLVIIDYLQLMHNSSTTNKSYNREQEVAEISKGLKSIAKEFDIPVIALSQLSRKLEDRGGMKRPQLSDLRESGAIEQDADIVVFIHRPEYYGIDMDEYGNSTKGLAEIIFAKHRSGALDTIRLDFIPHLTKFREPLYEYSTEPQPAEKTQKKF